MTARFMALKSILLLLIALIPMPALAGGIVVEKSTVELNGTTNGVALAGQWLSLKARASIYKYGSDEFSYALFVLMPKQERGVVQSGLPKNLSIVAAYLGPSGSSDHSEGPLNFDLSIKAPNEIGSYDIYYSVVPFFTKKPVLSKNGRSDSISAGISFDPALDELPKLRSSFNERDVQKLATFKVSVAAPAAALQTPPLYIRVNNQVPTAVPISGGIKSEPLQISWSVGNEYIADRRQITYRYKLYPSDESWSAWSSTTKVEYAFLQRGYHDFQVQARRNDTNLAVESKVARLGFNLLSPLISTVKKASFVTPGSQLKSIDVANLYPRSRALLVGLWNFDDRASFPPFEAKKIMADVDAMEDALRANGFKDVVKLARARLTKNDIGDALGRFMGGATKGDRLVVYFSTHGFADPIHPARGYLATSDCDAQNATARCLPLQELREQAERALIGREVKQVLFAVDSCFAGLGVVSKSGMVSAPDLSRLAAEGGAYMLTAGMADQKAEIDPRFGKSTFTHFLAKGLKGDADVMQGGVITLGELLLYLQFEVARATSSKQIPMMGRISGGGEMLFWPKTSVGAEINAN